MVHLSRILTLCLLLVSGPAFAQWSTEGAAIGARDHPRILARYGGEIRNPALAEYVAMIGAQMVAVSARPDDLWRFSVLDSPELNAFALPGGYIYVTRGLLALANNEAELAAILAHEITHVVEAHVESRNEAGKDALISGAIGALVTGIFGSGEDRLANALRSGVETAFSQMGSYSKAQEFAADAGGIELLRLAGYLPAAQADFLVSMSANAALRAEIAGRPYNEGETPFFANHPAPAERERRARALAANEAGAKDRAAFMSMIDGMVYGQSARGGIVRGQRFFHPGLGFTFEAAQGLSIRNEARQIIMSGENRSTLIMSGAPDHKSLREALQVWASGIPRRERPFRQLENLRELEINGLDAATATLRLRQHGQRSTVRLTVIRFGDSLIRFVGTVRRGDGESAVLQWQTIESFRPLRLDEAVNATGRFIAVYQVKEGDTLASLAAQMNVPTQKQAWFMVLNGLPRQSATIPGQSVKIVQ
ncbi:MAG: M48 family metalloprotease [Rhodobacteraceae bacterium]|nr:M48 family metalloprotease [Paracoccaceae bacterium]